MASGGSVGGAIARREPSLLALMRAQFTVGKRWRRLALALQVAAVGVGIVGTVIPGQQFTWPLTLIALFALLLGYLCQLQAERARALGERTRRTLIVAEGLGRPLEPRLEAELRLAFDRWARSLAARSPDLDRAYFTSTVAAGPARLRDYLQESVFWQTQLSKRMVTYTLVGVIALGLLLLASVLFALNSLDQRQEIQHAFARALAALVPFLVTTNAVRLWWHFHLQASALDALDAELDRTRRQGHSLEEIELLRLLHEYDIQLLQAPEVPDLVYRWHQAELNTRWSARAASYEGGNT